VQGTGTQDNVTTTTTPLFGTDGVRGRHGEPPLTADLVFRLGKAAATALASHRQPSRASAPRRVLIGRDTRESGPEIVSAISRGLSAGGLEAHDLGVVTTPAVAYSVRNLGAAAGVVVSASHNPWHDNGIKFFGPDGFKLSDGLEAAIEAGYVAEDGVDAGAPEIAGVPKDASGHGQAYVDHLLALARDTGDASSPRLADATDWGAHGPRVLREPDMRPFAGLRVVVDCANGAASPIAARVFRDLGAEVTPIHASPNGRNINESCGALHPGVVARATRDLGAHVGVTFDGDADRVMLADHRGRVADGDVMLLMLAGALKSSGQLAGDTVVTTIMANYGLELGLREIGVKVARTPVGDRHVVAEMLKGGYTLGGEQSGHVIQLRRGSTTGDGLFTALSLLRVAFPAGWLEEIGPVCGEPATALSDAIDRFVRTPQVLLNVKVSSKPPFETVPAVMAAVREAEARLSGSGRVVLRYSGTESLARVMVEGADRAQIESESARLASVVKDAIG
jgi:phosphoglucosamine mutase